MGYQSDLVDKVGLLQECITSAGGHSITSLQVVYALADGYTDLAPTTIFAHPDATMEFSREITAKGIHPVVDPLASTPRILGPTPVGREHYDVTAHVKAILQKNEELQDIIAILGVDELSRDDEATVACAYRIGRFLS